jgi:hypothetical protein
LASRKNDKQAQLYAFDMLAGDGEDFRLQALLQRKAKLAHLLRRRVNGIFIAEYEQGAECEQGEIGDVLFRVACNMGLEGIVSKRLDRAYDARKCRHWTPHVFARTFFKVSLRSADSRGRELSSELDLPNRSFAGKLRIKQSSTVEHGAGDFEQPVNDRA